MIYRIDIANDASRLGQRLRRGSSPGAAHRHRLRDRRGPAAAQLPRAVPLHLHRRSSPASLLLLLPFVPGLGTRVSERRRLGRRSASSRFQPGELAKIALAIFFAGYLVRTRDSLSSVGTQFLGHAPARALRDLGPILVVWARVARRSSSSSATSAPACSTSACSSRCSTSRPARPAGSCIGLGLVRRPARFIASADPQLRQRPLHQLARRVQPRGHTTRAGGSYQLVQGLFGLAQGGLIGTGLGQGRPDITPLAAERLHHRRASARSSA